jgi:hypothetical protein
LEITLPLRSDATYQQDTALHSERGGCASSVKGKYRDLSTTAAKAPPLVEMTCVVGGIEFF